MLVIASIFVIVITYSLYSGWWKDIRPPHSFIPYDWRRTAIQRTGLFVWIYLSLAGTVFAAMTFVGINFTLMTSFLSAPLWIALVLVAWRISRALV